MNKRNVVVAYRVGFGLLALVAVGVQLANSIANERSISNFFSFFTIESNIFAALVLLASGGLLWLRKPDTPLTMLRGAATLYMAMTGIIFALLLSGLDASLQVTIPWVNTVLHYIMPVVLIVDWFAARPSRRISFKRALAWIAYPVVYLFYSLVRGPIVEWYPYPFLNVSMHGYGSVIATSVVIAIGVLGLVWALTLPTRFAAKHS